MSMTEKLLPFRLPRDCSKESVGDKDLIAACAHGDNRALEELFRRHGDRVHRVISRLRMVERRDLDDIVQATFIETRRSAATFDGRAAVGTWILGIAMNVMRHHLRGESRRRVAMNAAAMLRIAPEASVRPDDQAAQNQAMKRLQKGVDCLSEHLRIVFTLCDIEGMRGVEVARLLQVPEGTVWRRLHEARTHLRECIGGRVTT